MSEKSQEILLSIMTEPPGMDADEFEIEDRLTKAIYESSKIDAQDHIGHDDFKYVWLLSKDDIQFDSIKRQAIFSEQILDKISEVYDFEFPINITLETQYEIENFYQFLEFLEYDNIKFLSYVWKFLTKKSVLNLDIEKFCRANADKIIKEVNEQLEIHPQPELITTFLKTLYKEKFIDWFMKNTNREKVSIQVEILT